MVLAGVSFLFSALVQHAIDTHDKGEVPIIAQLPQIFIMSVAEILVSVTGLEFAYTESPEELKAIITALFLATTGFGDLLAGLLYQILSGTNHTVMFILFSCLMGFNLILFWFVARGFRSLQRTDKSTEPANDMTLI